MMTSENIRLFAEQVSDHIEKLNNLMVCASGDTVDETSVRKVYLATRLLEGSTSMLGYETWSRTLDSFRKLLECSLCAGKRWDEQLSQIVSELLEAEEHVAAEIAAGNFGEEDAADVFDGIHQEMDVLLGESYRDERPAGDAPAAASPRGHVTGPGAVRDGVSTTLDALIVSLGEVRDMFRECVEKRDRGDRTVRDLSAAIGKSEFLFDIVREIAGHVSVSRGTFTPSVDCDTVLAGVRDFFDVHVKLRGWRAELDVSSDDIVLDGDVARSLAVIVERCLFDIATMFAARTDFSLRVTVHIANHGSFLEVKIFDNGTEFPCDAAIENDDAAALYKGLPAVRNHLERFGGLLWVEPDEAGGERFRFTLPVNDVVREYRIVEAAGIKLAVPAHSVAEVVCSGQNEAVIRDNMRCLQRGVRRIPLYRIDELAEVRIDEPAGGDWIIVVGVAEKRIGLYITGTGSTIKIVPDQIVEGDWARLCVRYLHCGGEEYPLLDMHSLAARMEYLERLGRVPETPGSFTTGEEAFEIDETETVPRAYSRTGRSPAADGGNRTERTERLSW